MKAVFRLFIRMSAFLVAVTIVTIIITDQKNARRYWTSAVYVPDESPGSTAVYAEQRIHQTRHASVHGELQVATSAAPNNTLAVVHGITKGLVVCSKDFTKGGIVLCKPVCKAGSFALGGMKYCQPWLRCDEIAQLLGENRTTLSKTHGAVKKFYKVTWRNYTAIVAELLHIYTDSWEQIFTNFALFQPDPHVIQLLGYCEKKHQLLIEYLPFMDAHRVDTVLEQLNFTCAVESHIRLSLCMQYVEILDFMFSRGYYFADTNSLDQLLSQYLLTNDLRLVLGDLDEVYRAGVNQYGVILPHDDTFTAPEFYSYSGANCSRENEMCVRDLYLKHLQLEIWKVPDVCNRFLGNSASVAKTTARLTRIHLNCKRKNPVGRPMPKEILNSYANALNKFIRDERDTLRGRSRISRRR